MPYKIHQEDKKYIVTNDAGKVMGTHDSKGRATKQVQELYKAMTHKEEPRIRMMKKMVK